MAEGARTGATVPPLPFFNSEGGALIPVIPADFGLIPVIPADFWRFWTDFGRFWPDFARIQPDYVCFQKKNGFFGAFLALFAPEIDSKGGRTCDLRTEMAFAYHCFTAL